MNGRTALGACLVLLAVLAGALFLDRSQRLAPVYAAAHDLPAGAPLKEGDLVVIRVRLPAAALRHYLQPGPRQEVLGRVLTAPVRRETLVPAGIVLASSRDAQLVELPVQADPGDMAQGLRPGDSVQVLAAYTEGARRGRAVVLLPSAEVVQVLQDPAGLAGTGQERGVQLRMPSDRAPLVVAAIATARIFVVKAPGVTTAEPPGPPPTLLEPDVAGPDRGGAEPGSTGSQGDPAAPGPGGPAPDPAEPAPYPAGPTSDPVGSEPEQEPDPAGSQSEPAAPEPVGAGPTYPSPGRAVAA
jgi:SAF domain